MTDVEEGQEEREGERAKLVKLMNDEDNNNNHYYRRAAIYSLP